MAKKQIIDYTFDPAKKTVTMNENVLRERLILITNVTNNTILYNFAEPTLGLVGDPVYDASTNQTTVVLIKDTTAMSATDNLQIYVEGIATYITPDASLMDSVSKLRVSTPESLIDTDFEYGLQSTKWETLRMVNNIPSFYSRTGDTPITVTAVNVTTGQKTITVTAPSHGLSAGIPFEINGLADPAFEGGYVVVATPDSNTFSYKVSFTPTSAQAGNNATVYTAVLPGAFYSGSSISLSSVLSDAASPSTITVNTTFPHGLNPGAEIYLVNTTAEKLYSFAAGETTTDDFEQVSVSVTPSNNGENSADYRARPVIVDDILGSGEKYFGTGAINTTTSTISIANHGFVSGNGLLFYSATGNTVPTGLADWRVYFATSSTNLSEIVLSETLNGVTRTITTSGTTTNGPFRFALANLVSTSSGTNITIPNHGYSVGDRIIFVARDSGSSTTIAGVTRSTNNRFVFGTVANQGYQRYQVTNVVNTNQIQIASVNETTGVVGSNLAGLTYSAGNGNGIFAVKIISCPEANCFYSSSHPFATNDYILFNSSTPATPLVTNTRYTIEKVTPNYFRLKDRASGTIQNLRDYGTNTGNVSTFARTATRLNRDTIRIPGLSGTLSNNNAVQYSAGAVSAIGGLTNNTWYVVKTVGTSAANSSISGDVASNYLRLAAASQSPPYAPIKTDVNITSINMSANATTATVVTASTHNYVAGDVIMIYGCAANPFFNDVYTVAASPVPTATGFTINLPTDGTSVYKNNSVAQTVTNSGSAMCIINLTGTAPTGTQTLKQSGEKQADDIYSIGTITGDRSFTAIASSKVEVANLSINPQSSAVLNVSATPSNVWIKVADHKLSDGVALTYNNNGNTSITFGSGFSGTAQGATFYAIVLDKDYFRLATTASLALARSANVSIEGTGTGTNHTFSRSAINSFLNGAGYIWCSSSTVNDQNLFIRGVNTKFLSTFTPGDIFKFYTLNKDGSGVTTSPGQFFANEIDSVKSDTIIKLKTSPGLNTSFNITAATYASATAGGQFTFTTGTTAHGFKVGDFVQVTGVGVTTGSTNYLGAPGLSVYNSSNNANGYWTIATVPTTTTFTVASVGSTLGTQTFDANNSDFPKANGLTNYFVPTSLYVKSDAITTHRPFDGGVNITSGNLPNSTIIRQTRKYFRYQPGKGIQVSLSVNFNPPFDVQRITSSGNTATVVTKLPHYLKTGGSYQVRVTEAAVNGGSNPYNGTFDVASIVDDYTFTYNFINYTFTGTTVNGQSTINSVSKTFTGNINNVASQTNQVNKIYAVSPTDIVSLQIGMILSGTGIPTGTKIKSISTSTGVVTIDKSVTTTASGVTFTVTNILDFVQAGSSITGSGIPSATTVTAVFPATNQVTMSNTATAGATVTLTLPASASNSIANGFPKYNLVNWSDAVIRAGLFDTQNGMFFEYDGQNLFAVRRSSTQQISGTVTVTNRSSSIVGDGDTRFTNQIQVGDYIVIRGQSYLVVKIESDTQMYVQPEYRGTTISNAIVTKTVDTKTPQYNWNIDKADGLGIHGYVLDINKIQMVYFDYSWYGAGKIRYGFKDQNGEVKYFHEYVHNNTFTEAYFRAGNLPGRYEVNTFGNPTFSPSLFHWGTSVIMDGRYDGDKAYLFTANSNTLSYTNGGKTTFTANLVSGSNIMSNISSTAILSLYNNAPISNTNLPDGTTIVSLYQSSTTTYNALLSNPATASATGTTIALTSGTGPVYSLSPIPLVSIRLAPSVDNSLTGLLGFRELINRMQLTLKTVGILCTHDSVVELKLNGQLSNDNFTSVGTPALSQLYKHSVGDTIQGGTTIFSFRASGGSSITSGTNPVRRAFNNTEQDLENLALIGNSILGGNNVYPNGPDVLTVVITPVDTSQITSTSPFQVSSRVTWTEAQA